MHLSLNTFFLYESGTVKELNLQVQKNKTKKLFSIQVFPSN